MGQAIEKHVLEHKRKFHLTDEEAENLEFQLIAQAFELSSRKKKTP